jgi:beta-xylosidase
MELLWKADLGDGNYRNPILFTDYSDPDVIRVGDTFFMTASSFNVLPGLPILISKDLVNWEIANYGVKHIPYKVYDNPAHAKGIWAPSIRYHEGKFWIFFGMPDEGVFMIQSDDPFGEWSPMTCIVEAKGWIDPCPYWDRDGKAYIIHAYAKSRAGFNSKIGIFEMTWDGTKIIGEDKIIFDGVKTQPTIEGPKVYKREDFYYIFAPAGGVVKGWQTVLRASNIYGPYEEKIVMHQGNTSTNGPHQGGLVDTQNGEEWFIHFQHAGIYGRITHLQPVKWEAGWPIIGVDLDGDGVGEPVITYKKPSTKIEIKPHEPKSSDEFDVNKLGMQWQWMANFKDTFYSLTDRKYWLRLYNLNTTFCEASIIWNSANILTQKIACPTFEATAYMDCSAMKINDKSGIVIIGGHYAYLAVVKTETGLQLNYVKSQDVDERKEECTKFIADLVHSNIYVKLKLNVDESSTFFYSENGIDWKEIKELFKYEVATWVGAKIGLFALHDTLEEKGGYTDFNYFRVEFFPNLKNEVAKDSSDKSLNLGESLE